MPTQEEIQAYLDSLKNKPTPGVDDSNPLNKYIDASKDLPPPPQGSSVMDQIKGVLSKGPTPASDSDKPQIDKIPDTDEKDIPDEDSDQEEPTPAKVETPTAVAPTAPAPASAPETPSIATAPQAPSVEDQLKQAQAEQQQAYRNAAFSKGAEMIGRGISHAPINEKILEQLGENQTTPAAAKVANVSELAKARELDIKRKQEKEEMDPKSEKSQFLRDAYKQFLKRDIPDSVSAAQLKDQFPQLAKLAELRDAAQARAEVAKQRAADTAAYREQLLGAKQTAAGNKASADQNKAYTEAVQKVQTFRGNRAAQQASMDVLSADKALNLVKNKDLNTLTTQDLRLLEGEIAKIATGGVPTEHGVETLMPNNLKTKWAEMKNFLLSNPTDANSAAYIKKNLKYLEDMKETSKNTLYKYQTAIAKPYKNRLAESDFKDLTSDIETNYGPKSVSGAKKDNKVDAYAQQNGLDYEHALKILTNRGYKPQE